MGSKRTPRKSGTQRRVALGDADSVAGAGGSSLTHNPFRALLGGSEPSAPAEEDATARDKRIDLANDAESRTAGTRIELRRERKGHGGKVVTTARLLDAPALGSGTRVDGAGGWGDLAKRAAKALGTGVRVKDGDLQAQGDQVERLARFLEEEIQAKITRGTQ